MSPRRSKSSCPYHRVHHVRMAGMQWMYTDCTLSCEWNTSELRQSGIAMRMGPLAYANTERNSAGEPGSASICTKHATLA